MANLFSVPIFFIVFRETLEAAIIISVLLGLAEQIVQEAAAGSGLATQSTTVDEGTAKGDPTSPANESDAEEKRRLLIRKLRIQVSASVFGRVEASCSRLLDLCWCGGRSSSCVGNWCSVSGTQAHDR